MSEMFSAETKKLVGSINENMTIEKISSPTILKIGFRKKRGWPKGKKRK